MLANTIAYTYGCELALIKLGTAAGPIAHKARSERNEFDFAQNRSEDIWREMDEEPATTGEESGVGMPSAGGIDKSAYEISPQAMRIISMELGELSAARYAAQMNRDRKRRKKHKQLKSYHRKKHGADDYASYTGDSYGSFDHNAPKPQKEQILSNAIDRAFRANEDYDKSYGMGEPPTTQPHGSKYALANPLSGGPARVSFGTMPKTPGVPSMPTLPKIPQAKAPGINIMSELKTNSNALLSSNSIMSSGTRAMGSPLPAGAQASGAALT